jgi:hypothetical protein
MRVEAVDNLLSMRNNPSPKEIHGWLASEWDMVKKWTKANNERVILNDYSHHPEKPFIADYTDD